MAASVLRVLTYHRVMDLTDASAPRPASVSATPAAFDDQMRYLSRRYRVVAADEVLAALREQRPLPQNAVLVTFDDAYCDFGEIAWPILRRYHLPATLFVPTAFPDRPELEFWWDRLHRTFRGTTRAALQVAGLGVLSLGASARAAALRRLEGHLKTVPHVEAMRMVDEVCAQLGDPDGPRSRVLGWGALRALAKDGVTLAPHTRTHPALTQLPVEQARNEIRGSREDLRREIGEVAPIFAYPFGAHDGDVQRAVREEGFELALTCIDGHNQLTSMDPLRMRRTNVSRRTSGVVFHARLSSYVTYLDLWRHRHQHAASVRATH